MTEADPLGMDPSIEADPADLAEQLQAVDPDATELPLGDSDPTLEADEGDLQEQELPVPDAGEDYLPE